MANYAASVLAKGQAIVKGKYQQPEQRRQMPTVMELALKNQSISIPNAQALRTAPQRPVEINYFLNKAAGAATAKAYNHTGTKGDTGAVQVTYVNHVETFSLPRKQAANNIFTYESMFANLYEMAWKNLRTRHDVSGLAFLYANRAQQAAAVMNPQIASAGGGTLVTWNDTNFALEIPQADKLLFVQRMEAIMQARFFTGRYDVVTDLQLSQLFNFASQQGSNNATNTNFQFGSSNFNATQQVIDAAYAYGACLTLPEGLFSGLNWNEQLNREGLLEDKGGSVGTFGTIADPMGSGAVADISIYTQRADTSADTNSGSTEDVVDQYELTLTIGYMLPPLSTAGDSVLMEFALGA